MTIDEAIAREREVEEMHRNDIVPKENYHNMPWIDKENELNMRSAEEHEQLAEWLEELKAYREIGTVEECKESVLDIEKAYNKGYADGSLSVTSEIRNKVIDDFADSLIRYVDCGHLCSPTDMRWSDLSVVEMVKELAKQLKAG